MNDRFSFRSPPAMQSRLLAFLRDRIDAEEFRALSREAGFLSPNEFDFESIGRPLQAMEFPAAGWYEIEWAIYECGWENLLRYSVDMKAYLASLYVYCNKRKQWSIVIDSDYFYLAIEAALESKHPGSAQNFAGFIEWLNDHVVPDQGYENYYELLSWALLQRIAQTDGVAAMQAVLTVLRAKNYNAERLSELTVSDRSMVAWLELHRRVPSAGAALDEQFERIILGDHASPTGSQVG